MDFIGFDDWDCGDWVFPVVLDLNGDGVDIRPKQDSTVYFDVDGDQRLEQTAWAGPTDGVLVIDLSAAQTLGSSDGVISGVLEVSFANWTSDPNDTDAKALKTVFDAPAGGGNNNGLLDAGDYWFSSFRVWKDANQNGVSEGDSTTDPLPEGEGARGAGG